MLTELIERLAKATGPDRELDGDISVAIGFHPPDMRRGVPQWASMHWFSTERVWTCPAYTESIDAALALLEQGWEYEISTLYHIGYAELPLNDTRIDPIKARHQTGSVPLAICIAALKARAALTGEER